MIKDSHSYICYPPTKRSFRLLLINSWKSALIKWGHIKHFKTTTSHKDQKWLTFSFNCLLLFFFKNLFPLCEQSSPRNVWYCHHQPLNVRDWILSSCLPYFQNAFYLVFPIRQKLARVTEKHAWSLKRILNALTVAKIYLWIMYKWLLVSLIVVRLWITVL